MTRGAHAAAPWIAVLFAAAATAQQQPPVFPREVEVVKVDVVVADKAGNPVTGLRREDFSISDDGHPQEVATFETVQVNPPPISAAGPPGATPRPRIATNTTDPKAPGRSFVIVFDNLHLTPGNALRAKGAVAAFLEKAVGEGDRVSIASTGAGTWWSARMEGGRPDLLAVLKGQDGRRVPENALERITDYEAMRIYVYQDTQMAQRVQQRLDTYGSKSRNDAQQARNQAAQQTTTSLNTIDPYIMSRTAEAYLKMRSRTRLALGVIERALKPLAASSDRKALLLVSEGFVFDLAEESFRAVTEAARRANAAIYFLDARGLEGLSSIYSAQFGAPIDERNLMTAIADTSRDGEGAETLAQDTGGFSVVNTNDLTAGLQRIGRESRSYYLLSYSPANLIRDGRFHKIDVRVKGRAGVTVRARKGYFAPADNAPPVKTVDRTDPEIQQALDAPFTLGGMPLRATAYVLDEAMLGRARVLIATDADVSKATFREAEGTQPMATLDTLVAVVHRDTGEVVRNDQRIDLARNANASTHEGPAWYRISQEMSLGPGVYQAKVVVRDAGSHRVGTVVLDFDVPPLDALRISTPILTDAVRQPDGKGAIVPVLLTRRSFTAGGALYCRFDVYGAARGPSGTMPRVSAGHLLRKQSDGTVVSENAPTAISPTSLGAIARMLQIPLEGVPPGEYDLVLTVKDEVAGKAAELVEPLTITASPSS